MLGAITAAAVIVTVLILLTARAVFGEKGREAVITVVPLRGEKRGLMRLIKALYWENRFKESRYRSRIILVSCGDRENDIAASELADELEDVEFVQRYAIEKYISEDNSGD